MAEDNGAPSEGTGLPSDGGSPRIARSRDADDALVAIVQSSDDAIYSKDRNTLIRSWNLAAERLYGYTAEEAIGQPIEMLVPATRRGEELDILARILNGERVHHYRTQRVRKDGVEIEVSIAVSPVHNADGEIVEAAVVARDITEQVRVEEALAEERDMKAKLDRKRALALNDEVVQTLAVAKLSIETGNHEEGLKAVTDALERAKLIVAGLLEQDVPMAPGDLVNTKTTTTNASSDN